MDEDGVRGERVILGLFTVLAACVVLFYGTFWFFVRDADKQVFFGPTVRLLYTPVVAFTALVSIDAYRHERSGWWLYLLAAPVPVLNIVLSVLWFRRWRTAPRPLGRWTL